MKTKTRALVALLLCTAAVGAAFFTKFTVAQSNINTLSGVFGCTLRDDRWGTTPVAGNNYDVSGLVWILDASNKKFSGINMPYRFLQNGSIAREAETVDKDLTIQILPTELMGVYKMPIDDDGHIYLVSTNGGNTLLLSGASGSNYVSQSGICQKM